MATAPTFTSTPIAARGALSAANTNRDGTGTIVDIVTAAAAGTVIEKIVVQATATTTAGMVRLYVHNGTDYRLFREYTIAAVTASASVACTRVAETFDVPLVIPTGYKIAASTHNAEAFTVWALGGDLT